ncbi:hypothetical protein [Acaryochloris marina]|uniref:DNA helicase n=1 Tax=Acaryochloris marina (strain MBIC 11017) TaxID=329726 RepID=B0C859_ACAM1|nr:hypothetical protein [Acaryochloris marina]ABW28879.1 hypothetical protein AM1_3894 [Acaryochloris marina MBIC11017]BDM77858.1 hypothetical protein AM10699_07280 [Acaryochloris marina MBIC10699]
MTRIKLIPAALRDLKQSSIEQFFDDIPTILAGMQADHKRAGPNALDTKSLQGRYKTLSRTKIPGHSARIIWKRDAYDKTVIGIDARDDHTYSQDYDQRQYCPCYVWHGETGNDWRAWVYDAGYKYSPVLTPEQEQVGHDLLAQHNTEFSARLIQSPPGTGKSITATGWASKYYRQGWQVSLIVPSLLMEEIERYLQQQDEGLHGLQPMTFATWLGQLYPDLKDCLASPDQEREAFYAAAKQSHHLKTLGAISYRDILLYQAYILDHDTKNLRKSAQFHSNQQRLQLLRKIKPDHWRRQLGNQLSRFDVAQRLAHQPPPIAKNTLIIIDEAQDYLLAELKAVIALCQSWQTHHPYRVHLWLLGDLNQRIQPVDFEWGQLELDKSIQPFRSNYRNSGHILQFANPFLSITKHGDPGKRTITAAVAQPEDALEVGDPVRLLVCESQADIMGFFQRLVQCSPLQENSQHRYLRVELAQQVKVLRSHLNDLLYPTTRALEFLDVSQAKGREFEGCIALPTFTSTDIPTSEQAYQWYTLLTRTRARLLVLATRLEVDEMTRLVPDALVHCDQIPLEDAAAVDQTIQWIIEAVGGTDAVERATEIRHRLLTSLTTDPLHLYADTYALLQAAKIDHNDWEQAALQRLQDRFDILSNPMILHHAQGEELEVSLRCLLFRAMYRSWDAVATAQSLQQTDAAEYQRLGHQIAEDLDHQGLIYEALRVRKQFDLDILEDVPFPELLDQSGDLLILLGEALQTRLADVIDHLTL